MADPKMASDHGSVTIILNKSQWEEKLEEAKSRRKIVRFHESSNLCSYILFSIFYIKLTFVAFFGFPC